MSKKFTEDFFKTNRENLKKLNGGNFPIVLSANGRMQKNTGITFPFRQDSNFWYLTGISEPDFILVITQSEEFLIVPKVQYFVEVSYGSIDLDKLKKESGVSQILDSETGWEKLESLIKKSKKVATLEPPPLYVDFYGIYTNPAKHHMVQKIKSKNKSTEFIYLRDSLAKLRSIKHPIELEAINSAIEITVEAFEAIKSNLSDFKSERDIVECFNSILRSNGVDESFDTVVASGKNATSIHHEYNDQVVPGDTLFVIDAGAEYEHYAADITRTYAKGNPTKRELEFFEAVIDAQEHAYSLIKPGKVFIDYEKEMEEYMGQILKRLGIIKKTDKESIRKYFPHATSHHLGLDAHDFGPYDKPFESNMVLAVEPGIYVPEEGIGVRVEDNVLITPNGVKILTSKLSSDLT